MANHESYQVAIDILRCHLGMSLEEAEKELGLQNANAEEIPITLNQFKHG